MTKAFGCIFAAGLTLFSTMRAAEPGSASAYAGNLLAEAGRSEVAFSQVEDLGHDEAFRITKKKGDPVVVEHQTDAEAIYGAQAVIRDEYESGVVEEPDFSIRGTTLCLMADPIPPGISAPQAPPRIPSRRKSAGCVDVERTRKISNKSKMVN